MDALMTAFFILLMLSTLKQIKPSAIQGSLTSFNFSLSLSSCSATSLPVSSDSVTCFLSKTEINNKLLGNTSHQVNTS